MIFNGTLFVVWFSPEPSEFGDEQCHMTLTSFVRSAYFIHMHILYCAEIPSKSTHSVHTLKGPGRKPELILLLQGLHSHR